MATVVQRADRTFVLGSRPHNHEGNVGAALAAKITARTKKEAVVNLFKPTPSIVNEVLLEELTAKPCPRLPKPINLVKAANHLQKRLRPADPTDLDFDLETEHIPDDFLCGDIKVSITRLL